MYTMVTPWPPTRNGIADYAMEIARHASAPLNVVTRTPKPVLPEDVAVRVMSDIDPGARRLLQRGRAIFHFGNNPDHVFCVKLFLRHGGVAVVHDATLHYLCECADGVAPGFFAAMLRAEQPEHAASLLRLWRQPDFKRTLDFQEVKLLCWLAEARAVIVHSHYAARVVGSRLPGVPVHVIPHFAYQPNAAFGQLMQLRARARARLGMKPGDLVVATLGFVTRNKQYEAVIQAIKQLPPEARRHVRFVVAGAIRAHEYDLVGIVDTLDARGFVDCLGYLSSDRMRDILLASDLICNLRYPTFGESSGSMARALGLGCGIVLTNTGAYAEIPADACFRVPAKPDPSVELTALFGSVLADRGRLAAKQEAAYEYARTVLDPGQAARAYEAVAGV